jgi:hypothetical protein
MRAYLSAGTSVPWLLWGNSQGTEKSLPELQFHGAVVTCPETNVLVWVLSVELAFPESAS